MDHIFYHKRFTFCLVCKKNIAEEFSLDRDQLVKRHLISLRHEKSIVALFKICIPDPCCESRDVKYLDIVSNSLFDLSQVLGNEPSYVCQQNENFACLLCHENICKVTVDDIAIKSTFVEHIQCERHINNIRNNAYWIYRWNTNLDFVVINNASVYCSVCKNTLQSEKNTLLQTAVGHLQTQHQRTNVTSNTREDFPNLKDEFSNQVELIKFFDNATLQIVDECSFIAKGIVTETSVITKPVLVKKRQTEIIGKETSPSQNINSQIIQDKLLKGIRDRETPSQDTHSQLRDVLLEGIRYRETSSQDTHSQLRDALLEGIIDKESPSQDIHFQLQDALLEGITDRETPSQVTYSQLQDALLEGITDRETPSQDTYSQLRDALLETITDKETLNSQETQCQILDDISVKISIKLSPKSLDTYSQIIDDQLKESIHKETLISQETPPQTGDVQLENLCNRKSPSSEIVLICPLCRECVDLFNDDVDFSMQFHMQKHKALSEINNISELTFQEGTNYICKVCNKTILIFNRNIELSLNCHIQECHHDVNDATPDECKMTEVDLQLLISNAFDNLPERYKGDRIFFIINARDVVCKLCNCKLLLNNGLPFFKTISDHVTDVYHRSEYQKFIQNNQNFLSSEMFHVNPTNSNLEGLLQVCEPYHLNDYQTSQTIKGTETSDSSKLSKDKNLDSQPHGTQCNIYNTIEDFESVLVDLSTKYFNIELNKHYIKVKDTTFFCEVCQVPITFTNCGSHLKLHCDSNGHNTILTYNACKFISNLQNLNFTSTSRNSKKFERCLKRISATSQATMISVLKYISYNRQSFICLLCSTAIPYSKCGKTVVGHCCYQIHRQNAYRINCTGEKFQPDLTKVLFEESANKHSYNTQTDVSHNFIVDYERVLRDLGRKYYEVKVNMHYIKMKDEQFFCDVCQISIVFTNCGFHLKLHFSSRGHNDILTDNACKYVSSLGEQKFMLTSDENSEKFQRCLKRLEISSIYGMQSNLKYITYNSENFFCLLCRTQIRYTQGGDKIKKHSLGKSHIQNTYRINCTSKKFQPDLTKVMLGKNPNKHSFNTQTDMSCNLIIDFESVLKDLGRQYYEIKLNQHYIKVKDEQFFCDVCQISIVFTNCGTHLKSHCSSRGHNDILTDNACKYLSSLGNQQFLLTSGENNEKFQICLRRMEICSNYSEQSNLKYITYNDENFFCLLCRTQIHFTTAGVHVRKHFIDEIHIENTYRINCNVELLQLPEAKQSDICKESENFDSLLNNLGTKYFEIELNKHYIKLKDNKFFCEVCQKSVTFTNSGSDLKLHCGLKSHNEMLTNNACKYLTSLKEQRYLSTSSENTEKFETSLKRMTEKYHFNNMTSDLKYIIYNSEHFICLLCNTIIYFTEHGDSVKKHFLDIVHRQNTYRVNCGSEQTDAFTIKKEADDLLTRILKKHFLLRLNRHYLILKNDQVFCEVCKLFIDFTENGTKLLLSHCYSKLHNQKLSRNATEYVSKYSNEQIVLEADENLQRFENVLSNMANSYPCNIMSSNLIYIRHDNERFFCILCNKGIDFSEDGQIILGHFCCKTHIENTYKLNCNSATTDEQANLNSNKLPNSECEVNNTESGIRQSQDSKSAS